MTMNIQWIKIRKRMLKKKHFHFDSDCFDVLVQNVDHCFICELLSSIATYRTLIYDTLIKLVFHIYITIIVII